MKIIESYNDVDLSVESKKTLYKKLHPQRHKNFIINLLPGGKSVWIDSHGDGSKANVVAFEHKKWKGIFDPRVLIKYYSEFNSPTMAQAINKYVNPTSIVAYESEEFRYLTPNELCDKIMLLVHLFPTKVLIYINLVNIDFNKLKYSKTYIIENVKKKINQNTIVHNLDNFKYLLEIN